MCEGPAVDTGICNEYECGDISPETYEMIRWELRHNYFSVYAMEGDNVTVEVPVNLTSRIQHESPTSTIKWNHNGNALNFSSNKFINNLTHITITFIIKIDFGTYIYAVHSRNNKQTPIKVVVIVVESEEVDKTVIEGASFVLLCRSPPLPYIYMDLTIKWLLNGSIFENFDIATAYARDDFKVENVHFNYSGIWSCVVEQIDLGFSWTTAVYRVKVLPRPLFLQHLMEDRLTRVIFGRMGSIRVMIIVLVIFVLFLIITTVLGTKFYLLINKGWKKRELKKSKPRYKVAEKRNNEERENLIQNDDTSEETEN